MSEQTHPTPAAPKSSGYALLIGIDHYDRLPSSAELPGSRNDVLMWHWFCREHLGIPVENIRMLTSPRLDPSKDFGDDTVPPESVGDAGEASLRDGYAWLLAKMDGGKNPGLLTYSGHGLIAQGRPALSTASLEVGGAGAILLSELGEAVKNASAQQALTAIFDCCHLVAPASPSNLRRSTGLSDSAETAPELVDKAFNVSHRVFLAARPGQAAYQCKLGDRFHSALSFALVTTAEQWKATNAPGQTGLDVDNKVLFKRARKLLRSLRMKQSPKLRVPFDPESRKLARTLPFFGTEARATTRKPDATRVKQQMPPDWLFTIYLGADTTAPILAQIVTMGRTQKAAFSQGDHVPVTLGGSSEQWYMNPDALSKLSASTSLFITAQQPSVDGSGALRVTLDGATHFAFGQNGQFGVSTYRAGENATWVANQSSSFANSYSFSASSSTRNPMLSIQLVVSPDGKSLTEVHWYLSYDSAPLPAPTFIQPGGEPATIDGKSAGFVYSRAPAPTPTSFVYSAVSTLVPQ